MTRAVRRNDEKDDDFMRTFRVFLSKAWIVPCATMATSLLFCKALGHAPSWMLLPMISMTGTTLPESFIYSVGFTASGVSMLVVACIFHGVVLRDALKLSRLSARVCNYAAMVAFIVASLGLIGQALSPFHKSIAEITSSSWLDPSSFVHILSAGTWFVTAFVYCGVMAALWCLSNGIRSTVSRGSIAVKVALFGSYFVGVWLFGIENYRLEEWAVPYFFSSLGQWVAVLTFIWFITSYSADLARFVNMKKDTVTRSDLECCNGDAIATVDSHSSELKLTVF